MWRLLRAIVAAFRTNRALRRELWQVKDELDRRDLRLIEMAHRNISLQTRLDFCKRIASLRGKKGKHQE